MSDCNRQTAAVKKFSKKSFTYMLESASSSDIFRQYDVILQEGVNVFRTFNTNKCDMIGIFAEN